MVQARVAPPRLPMRCARSSGTIICVRASVAQTLRVASASSRYASQRTSCVCWHIEYHFSSARGGAQEKEQRSRAPRAQGAPCRRAAWQRAGGGRREGMLQCARSKGTGEAERQCSAPRRQAAGGAAGASRECRRRKYAIEEENSAKNGAAAARAHERRRGAKAARAACLYTRTQPQVVWR